MWVEPENTKGLRYGYTTGANAAAGAQAALTALITGEKQATAVINLPRGPAVTFEIVGCHVSTRSATAEVIKDGGDDPDATHGARIMVTAAWQPAAGISLHGGVGVGRVTRAGLPVPVGEAAINPVPRKMIQTAAAAVLDQFGVKTGVRLTVSVPDGIEIAKQTLNPRLGIVGGISILGTRGIVVPFSHEAYQASIALAINVARQAGLEHVVITTGERSERYAMAQYNNLPTFAFIEMGNYVGFTLKICRRKGIKRVSMVGMVGKLSKVAQGALMVHSRTSELDLEFLAQIAAESGAGPPLVTAVKQANTVSEIADAMRGHGLYDFFERICQRCVAVAGEVVGNGVQIETTLYTPEGQFLGQAVSAS